MPEVSATISDLELKIAAFASTDDENDTSALQSMVEENPDDHASRHRLASLLFQEGSADDAINHALIIMRKDASWNDGAAKELLLQFFDVLGPDSEATRKGRARLTNLLFV